MASSLARAPDLGHICDGGPLSQRLSSKPQASLAAKNFLVQDVIARDTVWTSAHLALLQDRRGLGSHVHVYVVDTCRPHQPYGLRSIARPFSQQPSGHLLFRSELLTWSRHLACAKYARA